MHSTILMRMRARVVFAVAVAGVRLVAAVGLLGGGGVFERIGCEGERA